VDYLLKPFDGPRVAEALGRARAQIRARDAEQRIGELRAIVQDLRAESGRSAASGFETELWIDGRGGAQRVLVRDLDWIEAERDYVRLHVGERSYLVRDSIRGLVERLDPAAFVRIHRSAVVQRDRVAQLAPRPGGGLTAVLSTGARPAVGRSHAAAVRRLFRRPSARSRATEAAVGTAKAWECPGGGSRERGEAAADAVGCPWTASTRATGGREPEGRGAG
jgi:DNA-binding LytR/AlgR family response regulator